MSMKASIFFLGRRLAGLCLLAALACNSALAQGNGRLYDPEPPLDSGYVRVVLPMRTAPVDVLVDGKVRIQKLTPNVLSDYLVLKEGKHVLSFRVGGKTWAHDWEVARGKSMTLSYAALQGAGPSHSFEDRGNTNKLKAVLVFYHLNPRWGEVEVSAANAKVFGPVAYGASSALQVNPIAVELNIGAEGKSVKTQLQMAQGQTYSVAVFDEGGKAVAKVFPSAVERYTGN